MQASIFVVSCILHFMCGKRIEYFDWGLRRDRSSRKILGSVHGTDTWAQIVLKELFHRNMILRSSHRFIENLKFRVYIN